ncbi:ERCC4 domain-containing protein [Clostridium tagluense]|uniref:ERCC4 domain-containing protein n=1 Tax=Clostridium tagluense TaxID=360422 RepID=A0A401UQB3_9CLOT|nr:ERCC4 domain-containing protein [Clostridium tagluense]GCD11714.1 hypothetical protein Ctaglu_33370 [Clostridium tagluense]
MKYTEKQIKELLSTIIMLVDTREKDTFIMECFDKYDIKWKKYKLSYGDYSVMLPQNLKLGILEDTYFDSKFAIERKNSLNELGVNISTNRDRFKREFERCKTQDGKIILMIEENTFGDIVKHNYSNRIEPSSFLALLHSLSIEYNIPFIFVDKDVSFVFIYHTFKYYMRNELKNNNKIEIDKTKE